MGTNFKAEPPFFCDLISETEPQVYGGILGEEMIKMHKLQYF